MAYANHEFFGPILINSFSRHHGNTHVGQTAKPKLNPQRYTKIYGSKCEKNFDKQQFGSALFYLGENTQRVAEVFGEVGIVKY